MDRMDPDLLVLRGAREVVPGASGNRALGVPTSDRALPRRSKLIYGPYIQIGVTQVSIDLIHPGTALRLFPSSASTATVSAGLSNTDTW